MKLIIFLCLITYVHANCRIEGKTWNGTNCEYTTNSILCAAQKYNCSTSCTTLCIKLQQESKNKCLNNECQEDEWKNDCFDFWKSDDVNYITFIFNALEKIKLLNNKAIIKDSKNQEITSFNAVDIRIGNTNDFYTFKIDCKDNNVKKLCKEITRTCNDTKNVTFALTTNKTTDEPFSGLLDGVITGGSLIYESLLDESITDGSFSYEIELETNNEGRFFSVYKDKLLKETTPSWLSDKDGNYLETGEGINGERRVDRRRRRLMQDGGGTGS